MTPTDTTPECPRPECVQGRETALKPCPFCGGPAELRSGGEWFGASCPARRQAGVLCPGGSMALQHRTEASAAAAWNTRATEAVGAQAAPSGWKPIESAPKRGIILIGLKPTEVYEDGYVSPGYWTESDDDGPDNMGHDAGFVDVHYDFFSCARSIGNPAYQHKGLQPTHWMPLPAPPLPMPGEPE